jgi:hypothetical protein
MAHYFTDEDKEVRELIEECAEFVNPEVRADYLVNCLVLKHRQGMSVKEIFTTELEAKKKFEKELQK